MPSKPRSLRQEQKQLADNLRHNGTPWAEVANYFRERYRINMRVAFRLAHGWSQREAADAWNDRWPAEPKTFKNFSYWELWPADTGHTPSLDVLIRLAELYDCHVADMLSDCNDYRSNDPVFRTQALSTPLRDVILEQESIQGDTASQEGNDIQSQTRLSQGLVTLMNRLEEMSVEEIASTAAIWNRKIDPDMSRRGLLFKLSAGLSIAATSPALSFADFDQPASASSVQRSPASLEGIWHSRYVYYSSGRDQDFDAEHYIVFKQTDNQIVGRSLPNTSDSRIELELSIDSAVATGTWTERTSLTGYYKGATYHGTLQLFIDPMGRSMRGKWLGFGRQFKVNTGDWTMDWMEGAVTQQAMRRYHNMV